MSEQNLKAFRTDLKICLVHYERHRHRPRTCRLRPHTENIEPVRFAEGFGALNPNPHSLIFISISVGTQSSSYCLIPLLCECLGLFTPRQRVAETHPIYDAPLSKSARRVTEVSPKSPFLSLVFTSA